MNCCRSQRRLFLLKSVDVYPEILLAMKYTCIGNVLFFTHVNTGDDVNEEGMVHGINTIYRSSLAGWKLSKTYNTIQTIALCKTFW